MKKAITLTLGTGIFLFASAAMAQYGGAPPPQQQQWGGTYQPTAPPPRSSSWENLGDEGQIVVGVDRITGVALDSQKVKTDVGGTTVETTNKTTTVALFGVSGAAATGFVPRLALDYFPIESLSLGGSFLFSSTSGTSENDQPGSPKVDLDTTTTIGFAPRIGYAVAFDETFSIWPRGGITYIHRKTTTPDPTGTAGDSTDTFSGLELTLEALLGISPFDNFAIGIGPYVDFPLSGSDETCPGGNNCVSNDVKLTSFGLTTSIMGYFSP